MSTVEKGRKGEEIAASYLERLGYRVFRRNFRAYGAEIDIVAVKDRITVFAEVKFWRVFDFCEMGRNLDWKKRGRIIRASKVFLELYPVFFGNRVRYDVLYVDNSGKVTEHVRNAFTETDYS